MPSRHSTPIEAVNPEKLKLGSRGDGPVRQHAFRRLRQAENPENIHQFLGVSNERRLIKILYKYLVAHLFPFFLR
jgi:hypothetical protein